MRRCPICKNALAPLESDEHARDEHARNEHRWAPFCSERCRTIDLGNWLSDAYRIPEAYPSGLGEDPEEQGT